MNFKKSNKTPNSGFTMIEMLIVIAVIGIMSALVISAFSGAAQDTRRVVAHQQQAQVQNAINAWVNSRSADVGVGLTGARTEYNAETDSMKRLELAEKYLDEGTFEHFDDNTSNDNQIQSQALRKTEQYLLLGDWVASSYPKVELK